MSEELLTGQWAEPEDMAFWRARVNERAASRLSECPTAKMALEIREPDKAAQALYLKAKGELSRVQICRLVGIYPRELWRLEQHHLAELAVERPELAKRLHLLTKRVADVMEQKIDQIEGDEEELKKTSLKDIAITMGVLSDKTAQAAGLATTVVEHRSGPTIEEAMSFRDEIRQRLLEKTKIEAIDV